eukprot:scaffold250601_cov20-Tisochrysis_lutea.AAC.1
MGQYVKRTRVHCYWVPSLKRASVPQTAQFTSANKNAGQGHLTLPSFMQLLVSGSGGHAVAGVAAYA